MKCVARIALFATIVTLAPRVASAWNEAGHMIVAEIAWRQLDPRQRHEVSQLLRRHPHYDKLLAARKPEGVEADHWAFLRAAVWSDLVRPARPGSDGELFKGPEITQFHRGPWHYVSTPWQMPPLARPATLPAAATMNTTATTSAATRPALSSVPPDGQENILTALEASAATLSTARADDAERAVALTWLMHLVGDIHQPLHAVTMFAPELPEGDRGGNDIVIRGEGGVQRLHAYWDGLLGNSDAYEAIALLAEDIEGDPQLHRGRLRELAERPAFAAWAEESFRWAVALAYLNGRLRYASSDAHYRKQISDEDVPPLPHSYYANARLLARRRVALAGHRLAEQIVALLPPPPPSPPPSPRNR